jgi:hypothetical protein
MGKVNASKTKRRDPARFSARVQAPGGKIQEVGVGVSLQKMITLAKKHHAQHGWNTWVWNVRTAETVFGIVQAQAVQKAGGQ